MSFDNNKYYQDIREKFNKDISQLEDGFYYYFPNGGGAIPSWILREVADILDKKNEPLQKDIEKYFSIKDIYGKDGEFSVDPQG